MSRLLDKLEKASQPAPKQMGFIPMPSEAAVPPLALIIRLDADSPQLMKGTQNVADCLILRVEGLDKVKAVLKKLGKLPETLPWGVQSQKIEMDQLDALGEAGCDFLVFGIDGTPASVLNEEDIAKVLSIDTSVEEQFLRVLDDMPTDSIIIETEPGERLSVRELMVYRSILCAVSKPVMVRTRIDLEEGELLALQNAGFLGIIVEPRTSKEMKQVAGLRKAIEGLPPREEVARSRIDALLPPPGHAIEASLPEEDEEGEGEGDY
ncbi:MAG: hypothetical protein IIC81_02405, partial [Chloroflexi bacterium]|nr:hypothetical protein [Chloroflexota bacterium]